MWVCTHVLARVLPSALYYQREERLPPRTLASHTGPQPGCNFWNLGQNWGPSSAGVRARNGQPELHPDAHFSKELCSVQ